MCPCISSKLWLCLLKDDPDTAELGRATGRDFSGPIPEVTAPGPPAPAPALAQPENDRANSTAPSTDAKSGDEEIDQLPGESSPVRRSRGSARGKNKGKRASRSRSRSFGNRSTTTVTVSQVVESRHGPPAIVRVASLGRRSASPLPLDEIRRNRPRPAGAGNALLLGFGGRALTRGTDGE